MRDFIQFTHFALADITTILKSDNSSSRSRIISVCSVLCVALIKVLEINVIN